MSWKHGIVIMCGVALAAACAPAAQAAEGSGPEAAVGQAMGPRVGGQSRAVKRLAADGSVPARWNLAKPVAIPHPDTAPETASGTGDGSNTLSFTSFDDGDMIVVLGTPTGHAGCWSDALYSTAAGLRSYCVWSANTKPVNGVQREQPLQYRAYDRAFGLWVPTKASYGRAVITHCAAQAGEPYDILSAKTNYSRWYCSKLPWVAWKVKAGVDLDADGGYWVWPEDLINDGQTAVFAKSD